MIALLLLACGGGGGPAAGPALPQSFEGASCAVCGMVVGEQPAPRGQVAHRDGTHAFTCSLGDLRAYVQAPNPRGAPTAVWVESVPAELDLAATASLPWIAVEHAWFVVGFERPGVMGRAGLSAADPGAAGGLATRVGGRVVRWDALRDTPFSADPEVAP